MGAYPGRGVNNRRKLVIALGAGALSTALPAFAQQPPGKIPRIGILWHAGTAEEERIPLGALVQGLGDFGYIHGKNIILEHRFPNEEPERFISLAAELVQLKVDLFIAVTRPAALAAQDATKSIPIVFQAVPDPVGIKLVDSLGQPGHNITGLTNMAVELVPKRLELLKEAVVALSRAALVVNASFPDAARRYNEAGQIAARTLGVTLLPIEIQGPDDFERAFSTITQNRLQGVSFGVDGLFYQKQKLLAQLALERKLPTIGYAMEMAEEAGMLMSYGPSQTGSFNQTARFVDKILKGAKPADLPVEQPTKFELVVNMKIAKALGIRFPDSILLRADKVIK
jgi:putative tryptophan/tyrosine transport system substrate-binding protein